MKTWKAILALVLALCMVLALVACGNSESAADDSVGTGSGVEDRQDAPEPEELVEINVWMLNLQSEEDAAIERINRAVNAITEEELGVHVNFTWMILSDYVTKLGLAISGGEQVDLCVLTPMPGNSFVTMTASKQLSPVTEYLAEGRVAAELGELLSAYLGAYTRQGEIYGFPTYRLYGSNDYLMMRADVLEELGLREKAEQMTTWSEYEEILQAVQDSGLVRWGIGQSDYVVPWTSILWPTDAFADYVAFDQLGDSLYAIYTDQEGHVACMYDQQAYVDMLVRVADWYDRGWVYPDLATHDPEENLIGSGLTFSTTMLSEYGVEAAAKGRFGCDFVCLNIGSNMTQTGDVYKFSCAVPVTAEEPEAAMAFANLMYGSSEIMNLLDWGEEGTDYVMLNGEAAYPEGKSGSDGDIYHQMDFVVGNYFLAAPWQGNGADFREQALQVQQETPVSAYLGFSADLSKADNLVAAISAVKDEFVKPMVCGHYTEETYEQFRKKLSAAGIDEYVATFQTQLDAWLAGH